MLRWWPDAESNAIVVLYPQTSECWQWQHASATETDPLFDTHDGADLRTVVAMLTALSADTAELMSNPFSA